MSGSPETFTPTDLQRFTRRITRPLTTTLPPPRHLEMRVGKGFHLLLRGDGPRLLHVTIGTSGAGPRGAVDTAITSLWFCSAGALNREEGRWLVALRRGLLLVEKEPDWPAFLSWASAQPAVMLPDASFDPSRDPPAGNLECIRVETRCNGRCPFCSARGVLPDLVLDSEFILQRMKWMRRRGRHEVAFTGGEPTMRQDLPTLVAQAKKEGFTDITLQTNALLLHRGPLLDRLAAAGMTCIFVPLLSPEAEIHDRLIGVRGAFERTVTGIDRCRALGIKVAFNTVITQLNLEHLEPLMSWLPRRFPSPRLTGNISFIALQGWAVDHLELVPRLAAVRPYLRAALDTCQRLGLEITVPGICGLPMCLLPGYEHHFEEFHRGFQGIPHNRRYAAACVGCPHRSRCSGFWSTYLEHFGESELGYTQGAESRDSSLRG